MIITIILKYYQCIWVFPKIGVPQNGWFIMDNLIKMDDFGVPLFSETSISYNYTYSKPSLLLQQLLHTSATRKTPGTSVFCINSNMARIIPACLRSCSNGVWVVGPLLELLGFCFFNWSMGWLADWLMGCLICLG